jgi:hypothetical protein
MGRVSVLIFLLLSGLSRGWAKIFGLHAFDPNHPELPGRNCRLDQHKAENPI